MWLGHLLFDGIPGLIVATVVTVVFAAMQFDQFRFLPLLVYKSLFNGLVHSIDTVFQWFVMVLYGYTSTLFAYCISRICSSGLAAFSVCAAYQVIMFMARISIFSLTRLPPEMSSSSTLPGIF
jgi:ATP-binding cassette, subfamily A (ABC1), member 3